jgi:enoyl-CoA hydratase
MIRREERGPLTVLRLDHGKVNALDTELLRDLIEALHEAERSPARALVLTGSGGSFSAGVDLWRVLDGGADYIRVFLPLLTQCIEKLFTFPRPVVAALNGHAIAGGCIVACACDRRLMAAGRGRVGVPELLVGVPFPALALEIVRAATSESVTAELALTGQTYGTEEALRRGLVDAVVEPADLLERACEVASSLAAIPAAAFALVKRQLRQPALERYRRLAPEHDARVLAAWLAPESATAIRSYLDRTLSKGR